MPYKSLVVDPRSDTEFTVDPRCYTGNWAERPMVTYLQDACTAWGDTVLFEKFLGMLNWKLDGIGLQKAVYQTLRPPQRQFWVNLLKRRCKNWLPSDLNTIGFWDASLHNLQTVKGVIATSAVKTFLNSWTTTRRFHKQTRLKCIFGCTDKPDCALHYCLECTPLWECIGTARHCELSSLTPKLGSDAFISVDGLINFGCAFTICVHLG